MKKYIECESLRDKFLYESKINKMTKDHKTAMAWEGACMLLDIEPAADVVEIRHGKWEPRADCAGFVRCSVCHDCNIYDDWVDGNKWNYCPNCGARMDGKVGDSNVE